MFSFHIYRHSKLISIIEIYILIFPSLLPFSSTDLFRLPFLWLVMCKQLHWTSLGQSNWHNPERKRDTEREGRWSCCNCSATRFCCSCRVCWVSTDGHRQSGSVSAVCVCVSSGSTGSTICEVQAMSARLHNLAITTRSHVPAKVQSSARACGRGEEWGEEEGEVAGEARLKSHCSFIGDIDLLRWGPWI